MSAKPKSAPKKRSLPLFWVLLAAIAVIGIVVVLVAGGGSDDTAEGQVRPVTVDGETLPRFDGDSTDDPAIGIVAPMLTGQNFAGESVTIGADGRPKVVAFVAHWCPHCRAEVPRLNAWLDSAGLPEGVDLYIVSTSVGENDPNYPPSEWLEREGVSDVPTIADDAELSALQAFGAGGFPFIVYLDADNEVVLRTSGEYPDDPAVFTELFAALAAGEQPVDPRA